MSGHHLLIGRWRKGPRRTLAVPAAWGYHTHVRLDPCAQRCTRTWSGSSASSSKTSSRKPNPIKTSSCRAIESGSGWGRYRRPHTSWWVGLRAGGGTHTQPTHCASCHSISLKVLGVSLGLSKPPGNPASPLPPPLQIKIYEDDDKSRKEEIEALGGEDKVFTRFYDRLKEVREYHRRFPNPDLTEVRWGGGLSALCTWAQGANA